MRPERKKKQIPRYARDDKFWEGTCRAGRTVGMTNFGRGAVRVGRTGLESFGEEGFGVEVLLFEVGVEDHGEVADKDAA